MNQRLSLRWLRRRQHNVAVNILMATAAAALAACGGGGSEAVVAAAATSGTGGTVNTPATTTTTTSALGVRVIDGPIRNALVCLDINSNNRCDATEPQSRTDATGHTTLQIAAADVGKYPVLALVGTDAVDADHGPVTVPFVLKAPADQPAVVSPLTTLVQGAAEATGVKTAEAAAAVQEQLGTRVSLFQDFTASSTTESKHLGAVARMVVLTQQQQAEAIKSALGTQAIDGATITQADLDRLVLSRLKQLMPSIATAVASPAVQSAVQSGNPSALNTALTDRVKSLMADPVLGLQSWGVPVAVAVLNGVATSASSTDTATSTSAPLVQLNALTFTDGMNWVRRMLTTSAAGAVVDANNNVRYRDNRLRAVAGAQAGWSAGVTPDRQSDLHWNGSAWVACGLHQESLSKVRDALGRSSYNFCDGMELGSSQRTVIDVAGKSMLDFYNQARAAGYTNLVINDAPTVLGSATFPAGSRALYQAATSTATALAYVPNVSSVVRLANSAGLRAGDPVTCGPITPSTPGGTYLSEPASLEAMVAAATGTPCVYSEHTITGLNGVTLSSTTRNEWAGASTVSVGTVGSAPLVASGTATSYFTSNTILRVSFGANAAVTYWSCLQRTWDGSPRNCDRIGTGTYSVADVGDARVMTLNDQPVQLSQLAYERILVEREGKVFMGYKNRPATGVSARLNTAGANALLTKLGLPAVSPEDLVALTPSSFVGEWIVWPSAEGPTAWMSSSAAIVRIQPTGSMSTTCSTASAGAAVSPSNCTVTVDGAASRISVTAGAWSGTFTVDFVTGSGSGCTTTSGPSPVTTSMLIRRR